MNHYTFTKRSFFFCILSLLTLHAFSQGNEWKDPQINAVNREQLIDAQRNPEKHRHLIVRVWGWSGYFVELDKPYQDQIIQRIELSA